MSSQVTTDEHCPQVVTPRRKPSSLRIAIFTGRFPEPSETFIVNQIKGLIEAGHDVEIIAQNRSSSEVLHPDVAQYNLLEKTHYWPRRSRNRLFRLLQGARLWVRHFLTAPGVYLRALNPVRYGRRALSMDLVVGAATLQSRPQFDVLHVHFGMTGQLVTMLRQIGAIDVPTVVTFHGHDAVTTPQKEGRDCYQEMFRSVEGITINSQYLRRLVEQLGAPPEKITRIPIGVDLERFTFHPRQLPGNDRPLRILSVGRFVEVKGFQYALAAFAQVVRSAPERCLHYDFVGDGPLLADMQSLAEELGIAAQVTFWGAQPHDRIGELMQQAHIFIMPSVRDRFGTEEGQGLVLLEAQASGLPAIATRSGGIPEGMAEKNKQFLVPQKESDALAAAIDSLIDQADRWEEIGRAGRQHVEQHFNLKTANQELIALLTKLGGK